MGNKLLSIFGIDTDPIVGIDIGSTSVKLLHLEKKGEQLRVEAYGIVPLEPGVVVEKAILNRDVVISALKELISKTNIETRKVCVAVPNSVSITRVVQMNADLSDREIGAEIEMEADRYIPYPLEEVNLDYEIIGPVENNAELVNVMLAVSKHENVESLVDLMNDSGLTPSIVDIDSFAMERAFGLVERQIPKGAKNKIVALIDIGATVTTLNIIKNHRVIYTREQSFGGQQLIDEIQNRYGLTYDEAMLAKKYDDLPEDFYLEVLEPFKQTIAQQVSRACQFFFSSGDYSEVDYVVLTGGISTVPGLDHIVQEKIQAKTLLANPFANVLLNEHINEEVFENDLPVLMSACGLALRNLTEK